MTVPEVSTPGALRRACVPLITVALLTVGGVLARTAGDGPLTPPFVLPALLLLPMYFFAQRCQLDFEFRKDNISISLTQLPLALGVLLVPVPVHLVMRVIPLLIDSLLIRRLPAKKVVFNLGSGVLELGVASALIGLLAPMSSPDYRLWLALLAGLLLGDLVSHLALQLILLCLGRRSTLRDVLAPVTIGAVTSVVFTGVAVLALAAAWTDAFTILVTVGLAGVLAIAYRGHRTQSARERSSERLYDFVRELKPVTSSSPDLAEVLERIRLLLHCRSLDLAVCDRPGEAWRHIAVWDEEPGDGPLPVRVLTERQVEELSNGPQGSSERMTTPLAGAEGIFGVLTASERLGNVRAFDMADLRLLETVGAELATALDRGRLIADLQRSATTDLLTELPNLPELTRLIEREFLTAGRTVVVAAVAVESFREVNDTLGHELGDALLQEVAQRLRSAMPHAVVGRIGGGRFAVASADPASAADPALFGLNLRAKIEGTATIGGVGTHVRLAVGCATGPEQGRDAATLLRRAETASRGARLVGGGPVLWEPAYEVTGQRRLAVVTALREAIATGAVAVAYQPKVAATTGLVTGVEALARWEHAALGTITPDEFIPLAEASGLMGPLTTTVLRQSLRHCRAWQQGSPAVGVSVNVSAESVLEPGFITEVAALLRSVDLPADLLTLELTESIVVRDPALAVERMDELRALGVKLAVDDFGTGYSSLTYLKGLPVDEVKIDKGFVDGLAREPADRAVVRAVVDIAHTLGLTVVAEGVEQEAQRGILRALGVDELQGYLHARPMPAADVPAWLGRNVRAPKSLRQAESY